MGKNNWAKINFFLNIVKQCLQGYNGTLFAYGQTASGKSHTMMGDDNEPGLMLLAADEIFDGFIDRPDCAFLVRLSYLEIYNEEIKDLLEPDSVEKLKIYDHPTQGPYVKGATEKVVHNVEEFMEVIKSGELNRHVGHTKMNAESSRSHSILRLVIESRKIFKEGDAVEESLVNEEGFEKNVSQSITGKSSAEDEKIIQKFLRISGGSIAMSVLNLIDLAGSERASRTGNNNGTHMEHT